jgi:hypothetical protein
VNIFLQYTIDCVDINAWPKGSFTKGADMALTRSISARNRRGPAAGKQFRVVLMRCSDAAEVMTLNTLDPEATNETLFRNRDPRARCVRVEPVTN